MRKKGKVIIEYTLNGKTGKIEVHAELRKVEGILKPRQNLWYGVATFNEKEYHLEGSEFYVDAQFLADDIADIELKKLRAEHGRALRLKRK